MIIRVIFWLTFCVFLTSCAASFEYTKLEIPLPETQSIHLPYFDNNIKKPISLEWWRDFRDPYLDKLVSEALQNNDDLLIAAARMEQSFAVFEHFHAQIFPLLTYGGEVKRSKSSQEVGSSQPGITQNLFSLSMAVSYEIDLWGELRKQEKAYLSRFLAAKANKEALRTSLIANVVTTYFNLLSLHKQVQITETFSEKQREIYEFRRKQLKYGLVNELLVQQTKAEYEATKIRVENLKHQKELLRLSLSLLLGKNPKEIFEGDMEITAELPFHLPLPNILPSEILEKRPDIVAAQANLEASQFEVEAVKTAYFPKISLTAGTGFKSNDLDSLIKNSVSIWNLSAIIAGTILDFERKKSIREIKEAQRKEALIQYVKTVKTAFKEIHEALVSLEAVYKKLEAQKEHIRSVETVLNLAEKRFEIGLVDYIAVLDAQRNYLNSQLNLSILKTEFLNYQVYLYKALGGGWE